MNIPSAPVNPFAAGIACRCPRCGKAPLFTGAWSLDVRARCESCGLDLKFVDPGDGPAVFAIMILGFVVLGLALIVEFKLQPPMWVHVAVFAPLTLLLAFGLLRPMKAVMVALQFKNKAAEGRLDRS